MSALDDSALDIEWDWPEDAPDEPRPATALDDSRFVHGGAFLLDQPPGVPAVWGRGVEVLWAQGESLLINGPTGVGKTTIAAQLVEASVGLGDGTALGLPVTPAERLLYLACDRPKQVARAIGRLFTPADRAVLDERLVFWKGPPPADIANDPLTLLRLARHAGADRVIIDSLKDVALELSSDRVGAGVNSAFQHLLAEGIDPAALHHQRKAQHGGPKPKTPADVYGSTWIVNGAGSVVLLWGEPGDALVELSHLKQPAEMVGPWQVAHDHHAGRSTVEVGTPDPVKVLTNTAGGITAMDLARIEKRGSEPNDNDRRRAERKLDRLVRQGQALREDARRGGRGGTTPARYFAAADRATTGATDAPDLRPGNGTATTQRTGPPFAQVRATDRATGATDTQGNGRHPTPLHRGGGPSPVIEGGIHG